MPSVISFQLDHLSCHVSCQEWSETVQCCLHNSVSCIILQLAFDAEALQSITSPVKPEAVLLGKPLQMRGFMTVFQVTSQSC